MFYSYSESTNITIFSECSHLLEITYYLILIKIRYLSMMHYSQCNDTHKEYEQKSIAPTLLILSASIKHVDKDKLNRVVNNNIKVYF